MVLMSLQSPTHNAIFSLDDLQNRIRDFLQINRIQVPQFTEILNLNSSNIPAGFRVELPVEVARKLYVDFGSIVHQLTFYGTMEPDNKSSTRLEFASTMLTAIISACIANTAIVFHLV